MNVENLLARIDPVLWLVTAQAGDRRGGLIATFVNSASIVPEMPRVLVGIARTHFTWELLETSGAFGLHLLGESNLDWVWRFGMTSGKDRDKFAGLKITAARTGSPVVEGAIAWLDCRVETRFDIGDRTLYLAEVFAVGPQREGAALTVKRMLELATPEQRVEMKRQREADGMVDAMRIGEWRSRR